MLDFDKLEKMVDEALAKETKESLEQWLKGEMMQDFEECLNYAQYEEVDVPTKATYSNASNAKKNTLNDLGKAA